MMGLTLAELRHEYPHLFYRNQDWFVREHFVSAYPSEPPKRGPVLIVKRGVVPTRAQAKKLPSAVDLATVYVDNPSDPSFQDFLWTSDRDAQGQQVFVGGCANGHGFEVHRHIAIGDRFCIPALP